MQKFYYALSLFPNWHFKWLIIRAALKLLYLNSSQNLPISFTFLLYCIFVISGIIISSFSKIFLPLFIL